MKALRIIGIVIGALVALFLAASALSSGETSVSHSIQIARPAAQIFPLVSDFNRYQEWQPWKAQDPKALYTISNPAHGVGAKMAWESEVVGTASNTITAVNPNTEVQYQLVFVKPFEGTFKDYMKLEPNEAGTKVTWYNEQPPLPFAMRLMAGMIKADISKAYQDGLTNLKAVAEAQAVAPTDSGAIVK